MKEIVLAAGCFWGVEAYFSKVKGVVETEVGYANGNTENPTYDEVCHMNTGHAEACYIKFDDNQISLGELLKKYWKIVDPTVIDRQGPDVGAQYRTGIYYMDNADVSIIKESVSEEQKSYKNEIVTEVKPLENYYKAEEVHQKYLEKNPRGYCHIDLSQVD